MFTAQTLTRDMIAAGRAEEIYQIRRIAPTIVLKLPDDTVESDHVYLDQSRSADLDLRPNLDESPEGADEHA